MPPFVIYRSRAKLLQLLTLTLLLLCLFNPYQATHAQGDIIYVDDDATGANDGTSWVNAFTKLQDALAAATDGDQIWVAGGVYYPDEGGSNVNDTIGSTFLLKNGVALYGGFAANETDLALRNFNPNINASVLSGDITQNDVTDASKIVRSYTGINTPNSTNVVTSVSVDATTILDGFVLTGGSATLDNALCASGACGGALYATNSSLTLANLTIIGNTAYYGGGMVFLGLSTPTLTDMRFEGNRALGNAGGLVAQDDAVPTLTRVTFDDNRAEFLGGGAYFNGINPTLQEVTFVNNEAEQGGALYTIAATVRINDSVIDENYATDSGGGIYSSGGSLEIQRTQITKNGNSSGNGGAIYANETTLTLKEVDITENVSRYTGGAIYATGTNYTITLVDVDMILNQTDDSESGSGGALYQNGGTLKMLRVLVSRNVSIDNGGGVRLENVNATLTNVQLLGNYVAQNSGGSSAYGGGMAVQGGNLIASNLLVVGNHGHQIGGLYANNVNVQLNSVTIAHNVASPVSPHHALGIMVSGGTFTLTNSVIWDGTGTSQLTPMKIYNATATQRNVLTEGPATPADADGNLSTPTSPFRVDPIPGDDGFGDNPDTTTDESINDNYGNLRLKANAIAIDTGNNALLPADLLDANENGNLTESLPLDVENALRVTRFTAGTAIVDRGAYEYQNQTPLASLGGPYALNEGGNLALNAAGSSDDGSIATYAWDCTNNGSTDASAAIPTGNTCAYANSGSYTLRLTVTDNSGATNSATAQVSVANIAPVFTPSGNQSTFSGSAKLFSLGSFTDPGAEGTWTVTIDWGDDSTPSEITADAAGTLPTTSHTYAVPGAFNVLVTISDDESSDDGGFQVVVNAPPPGAPVVSNATAQSADVGVQQSFALGEFTDAGSAGPWQVTIQWGDDLPDTTFSVTSSGEIPAKPHTYASAGTYDVLVTISDGALQSSSSFRVTVTGEDPGEEPEADSKLFLPTTRKP